MGQIVVIAESVPASRRAIALAREFGLCATAGVHPHEASSWSSRSAALVADALSDPHVVAVGETGLDYHYDHSPRDAQREAFAAQLELAATYRKPVVVHARDADEDVAQMLRTWGDAVPAVVLHSFSSGSPVFEAGMAIGAYFGWSGMITFKNWKLADCLVACPSDRLLLETDAPYLAPVPHRGKRNEPAFVRRVAEQAAAARGIPVETLAHESTANAVRCFGERVAQLQPTRP